MMERKVSAADQEQPSYMMTEEEIKASWEELKNQPPSAILSDDEILDIVWDGTPFHQQDPPILDVGEAGLYGFWRLAEEIAKAAVPGNAWLTNGQARALLAIRAAYFLGVLRGAEAYRRNVMPLDEDRETFEDLPLDLDAEESVVFAEDLNELPPELFNCLTAMLGLSVPWAAERGGDGA